MSKFRKYDVSVARQEEDAIVAACNSKHQRVVGKGANQTLNAPWSAEYQILKLRLTASKGLMDCYKSFEQSLTDFYVDFPWSHEGQKAAIKLLLADSRLPAVVAAIKDQHGFDLEADLRHALTLD